MGNRIKFNSGGFNSVLNRLFSYGPKIDATNFSWRGEIEKKSNILQLYNFNLVVENATGYPGYITEKILHSYVYGSIPIYFGAKDAKRIFKNYGAIFIDEYDGWDDLIYYLMTLKENDILDLQTRLSSFFESGNSSQFDAEFQAHYFYSHLRKNL